MLNAEKNGGINDRKGTISKWDNGIGKYYLLQKLNKPLFIFLNNSI